MRYHNITKDDMLNGDGLRTVLWVAGCSHGCKNCHNPVTWDICGGIPFDEAAKKELFEALEPDYISGITFSGGDPLHMQNRGEVGELIKEIREKYPNKTIWCFSGYLFDKDIVGRMMNEWPETEELLSYIDVLVDGEYGEAEKDLSKRFKGSANQRTIDVQKSLKAGCVVLVEGYE